MVILGVLCALTVIEYLQLQGFEKGRLILSVSVVCFMYLSLVILAWDKGITTAIKYAIFLSMVFTILLSLRLLGRKDPFSFSFQIVPATLYIAVPLALLFALSVWTGEYQPWIIMIVLLFVWINDVMAYLIGKNFGKYPMSKFISPNKTWEGTLAGWISCLVAAVIFHQIWPQYVLGSWIVMAGLIAVTGTVGDLIESMFKRQRDLKDTGTFLPGHGGLLDRLDSLLFCIPFVALYFFILDF